MREMLMLIMLLFFVTTMCQCWWCGSCDEGIAAREGDGVVIMREMVMIVVLLFFFTTMCRCW